MGYRPYLRHRRQPRTERVVQRLQSLLLQVDVAQIVVGGFAPNWFTTNADDTFTLLGRPLVVWDRCSALGTKGDIFLCDLKSYLVGIRRNAELAVDTSIGF